MTLRAEAEEGEIVNKDGTLRHASAKNSASLAGEEVLVSELEDVVALE